MALLELVFFTITNDYEIIFALHNLVVLGSTRSALSKRIIEVAA